MKSSTDLHQTDAIRLLGNSARTTAAPIPSSRIELPDVIDAAAIPLNVSMIKKTTSPYISTRVISSPHGSEKIQPPYSTTPQVRPPTYWSIQGDQENRQAYDWISPGTGVYTMFFSTTHLEPARIPNNDSYHRTLLKPSEPFIVDGEEE